MRAGKNKPDSPEDIKACLNCEKAECVNCLRYNYSAPQGNAGRPGKPIVAVNGDEWHLFNSAVEAAKKFGISSSAISSAVRGKHRCAGYFWRYV